MSLKSKETTSIQAIDVCSMSGNLK